MDGSWKYGSYIQYFLPVKKNRTIYLCRQMDEILKNIIIEGYIRTL